MRISPRLWRSNHPMPVYPAGVVCLLGALIALAQEPSFRTSVDFVLIDASVTDSKGVPVSGLTADNFEVKDGGRLQEIVRFDSGSANISVAVVADFSGSMRARRFELARGVGSLADLLHPDDDALLITFNDRAALIDDVPPDAWRSTLASRMPAGRTALYDAVQLAGRELTALPRQRRVIILLSDGADTASVSTRAELLDSLRTSGALVYCVGLFGPNEPETDAGLLKDIAEQTGGFAYFDSSAAGLPEVFNSIMQDLRARYVLMFRAGESRSGKREIRKISVRARGSDGDRLRVRARREYSIADPVLQRPEELK